MEALQATFEEIKNAKLNEGKAKKKIFQDFIKDFSEFCEESYTQVDFNTCLEMAEYSQSAPLMTVFKNKDLKKNLVKRCLVRPILIGLREPSSNENYTNCENLLDVISQSITEFQKLEIVRSLHFYCKEEDLDSFKNLLELFQLDEETMIAKLSKQNSFTKGSLGSITVEQLKEFGLNFDFITNEKLCWYFRNKTPAKVPHYIEGLENLMNCLEEHGHELEVHLFPSKETEPYIYSGELANFVVQTLTFCVKNIDTSDEELTTRFNKLFEIFISRCINLKILLNFAETIRELEIEKFTSICELLENRAKNLSEITSIIKTIEPKVTKKPVVLSGGPLSIDLVLTDLFKIAMNSFTKEQLDLLNNEALALFDELEGYIEKTKKFPLFKLQGKVFKALDIKVGSKCSMTEAKAWKKVIHSLWKTGICKNQIEKDTLMKKANRFTSKKNFERNKKKIKKEFRRRQKDRKQGKIVDQDEEEKKEIFKDSKMPEESKDEFKHRMERKKASELITELECLEDGNPNYGAPRSMVKFKEKVEKYWNDQSG
ncbi:unnamed protein product [Moneuplotes crassus]|uniref:Uncharacterized protein n=1 Tax=Euplotes crassus TaxID=5936 RepID=A0AAD1X3J6_EUPCR|nr:unnamed protein product [Moneuplotes crassus]